MSMTSRRQNITNVSMKQIAVKSQSLSFLRYGNNFMAFVKKQGIFGDANLRKYVVEMLVLANRIRHLEAD